MTLAKRTGGIAIALSVAFSGITVAQAEPESASENSEQASSTLELSAGDDVSDELLGSIDKLPVPYDRAARLSVGEPATSEGFSDEARRNLVIGSVGLVTISVIIAAVVAGVGQLAR